MEKTMPPHYQRKLRNPIIHNLKKYFATSVYFLFLHWLTVSEMWIDISFVVRSCLQFSPVFFTTYFVTRHIQLSSEDRSLIKYISILSVASAVVLIIAIQIPREYGTVLASLEISALTTLAFSDSFNNWFISKFAS